MTQKQYEKDFKERFGVEPFTEDEVCEIKAILFNMGMHPDCGKQPNRYIRYHSNAEYMEERRMKKQAEDAFYEELASFVNYG